MYWCILLVYALLLYTPSAVMLFDGPCASCPLLLLLNAYLQVLKKQNKKDSWGTCGNTFSWQQMLIVNIIYDNSNNSYTVLYLIKSYKLAVLDIINNKNEIMTLSTHAHTHTHKDTHTQIKKERRGTSTVNAYNVPPNHQQYNYVHTNAPESRVSCVWF